LWQTDNPDNPAWLASLEDPHTRQIVSFNSLERLFEFLQKQTGVRSEYLDDDLFRHPDRASHE
jgi:hypothetical protein